MRAESPHEVRLGLGDAPRRALVIALALGMLALACSQKKPDDKPTDKADGMETSYTGYVSKTCAGDLVACVTATKAALQRLNITLGEESGAIFKKTISGASSDGTSVTIKAAELSKTATRVSVKVGSLFGDEDAARRILSEIDAGLAPPRAAGGTFGGFATFGDLLKPTPAPR